MISSLAIKQFIEIYEKEFGTVLTPEEAKIKATNTLSFFRTIISEISKDRKVKNCKLGGGVLTNGHKNKSNTV